MNISFSMTQPAIRQRIKTVTRRDGWEDIKLGVVHNAIEKGQGLRRGEHIVIMDQIIPISSRWETLQLLLDDPDYGREEVRLEGFPDLSPAQFVEMLCLKYKCDPSKKFNRIEFRYVT